MDTNVPSMCVRVSRLSFRSAWGVIEVGNSLWRCVLILAVVASGSLGAVARANVTNATGTNVQNGGNRASTSQSGNGKSGSAVGGQVSGVVSSGRTSVDATNRSANSDVRSGAAHGSNTASSFVGLATTGGGTTLTADLSASCGALGAIQTDVCRNLQDGSNRLTNTQVSSATTGDGVAGQVIGAVTSAGGSASIVADNLSQDSSVATGNADSANHATAFVGLLASSGTATIGTADLSATCDALGSEQLGTCSNVQDGSNRSTNTQNSSAATGDGVAGQVIGAVSAGATSIDARNRSVSDDVTSGNADSANHAAAFVGLLASSETAISAADVSVGCSALGSIQSGTCQNLQNGDNRNTNTQNSSAATGDGVAGSVIGAVTSAGGSSSVVADNLSQDSSVDTGDAGSNNHYAAFVGLAATGDGDILMAADVAAACGALGSIQVDACQNVQDGSNRASSTQNSSATTGDGVAGQVIGAVSAGATSIDARNRSVSDDATSGNADSANHASVFVGLAATSGTTTVGAADLTAACDALGSIQSGTCQNLQDGSNTNSNNQAASAASGDAIAGQVTGDVTSAGGSASIVVDNTSTDISSESGASRFDNSNELFVGLFAGGALTI